VANPIPPIQTATLLLPGSIPLEMCRIPAGEFWMGSREPQPIWYDRNGSMPRHRVRIQHDYWLSQTPIRLQAFRGFVDARRFERASAIANDSSTDAGNWITNSVTEDDQPVVDVSWLDAMAFCDWLNAARQTPDANRQVQWPAELAECQATLPTEAQWERACRGVAGEQMVEQQYGFGDGVTALEKVGWFGWDRETKIPCVRRKEPTDWGLFDMHGLVWEWMLDEYRPDAYENRTEITIDPLEGAGVELAARAPNTRRVLRCGSWNDPAPHCRSAVRGFNFPTNRFAHNGFRLAIVLGPSRTPTQRE